MKKQQKNKRSGRSGGAARRSRGDGGGLPADPVAIRVRFEHVRLNKALKHARDMARSHRRGMDDDLPPPPPDSGGGVIARDLLDRAIDAYVKYKWCSDTQNTLDNGIKFLQDYHNQMTEKEREDFRKLLASLLDAYSDIC